MQAYREEKDALTDCLINIGVCNQRLVQYDQAVEIFNTGTQEDASMTRCYELICSPGS